MSLQLTIWMWIIPNTICCSVLLLSETVVKEDIRSWEVIIGKEVRNYLGFLKNNLRQKFYQDTVVFFQ